MSYLQQNCDCDLVITVGPQDNVAIYSVAYKGENNTLPNDVQLLGLFEPIPTDEELSSKNSFIPINAPITPNVVPRFNTLRDFADGIALAIEDFTGIPTGISVRYNEATDDEPGSFVFGIQFEKDFDESVSFRSSVELGDIASVKVVNSLLSIKGGFRLFNEFGVRVVAYHNCLSDK